MNKFVMMVFRDEAGAYEGLHALSELHREGTVTVYGTAVIAREADGRLHTKQRSATGPLGVGVGALAGGLVGLFGGPIGVAVGAAAGGAAGGTLDLFQAAVSEEFVQEVKRELTPGKFAVIAEVAEDWLAPLDARMEALGATVVREGRVDFTDELIERTARSARAELEQWKAEQAGRFQHWKAEQIGKRLTRMEERLAGGVEHAREKLERTAHKARERLAATKEETDAKLKALEEQAARAEPEVRARIEERVAELRAELAWREQKLNRAFELTAEALQP